MANSNFGCITEQGCLGLGFTPVTDSELNHLKEDLKTEWDDKQKDNTEDQKDK